MPDLAERVRSTRFHGTADRAGDLVYTYSGGMKRRVSLACALVHRPDVLFLDEPTAAVDPALRARFWLAFRDLAARGATLFISTHLMDEAMLCDEVAVLRQGRVIAADTPARLLQRGRTRLIVRTGDNELELTIGGRLEDLAAALQAYGLAPDVRSVEVRGDTLESVVLDLVAAEDDQ
ncbi:MAG: ABC transporter ATP-binding protein [Chloroflexia bacterium]